MIDKTDRQDLYPGLVERNTHLCLFVCVFVFRSADTYQPRIEHDLGSSTAGELVMATKRSLMAMRARGPSRQPGCHKLGCRDLKRNDRLEDAFRTAIGERWRCSAQP